jgi:RimJ/RimL family protein N-acetyltransferase
LLRTAARVDDDEDDFASFSCWDGDASKPWAEEAENFIRAWVLRKVEFVLAFREEKGGDLVAVSAFDRRTIGVPLLKPSDQPGWHLQVVAVRLEAQGKRLAARIMSETFAAMREIDPSRILCTANVHRQNGVSLRACARAGFFHYGEMDDYIRVLAEVPAEE